MIKDKTVAILGTILFISLSINLFTGGMMVGGFLSPTHKAPASGSEEQDRKLRETMSEADKLVLKQAMDVNRQKITMLHDELENFKSDIRNIIKRDPVDEKALNDVLDAQKKKELEILHLAHKTRKAATDQMSPEGRAIMSKVGHLGFDLNAQCR
jgi:uncharacterized membrane protein